MTMCGTPNYISPEVCSARIKLHHIITHVELVYFCTVEKKVECYS